MKNILITGDDGYNSIGVRLVAKALKDKYNITIVGTLKQQSGVGGKLSLDKVLKWGKDTVDGIPAFWVDGSPVDSVSFAKAYLTNKSFDLLISGMNFGSNVSSALISSGTFGAAFRALSIKLAPKAIAISMKSSSASEVMRNHDHKKDGLEKYEDYPGKWVKRILNLVIQENLWGVNLLNINLPSSTPKGVKFTKIEPFLSNYYNQGKTEIKNGTMQYKTSSGWTDRSLEYDTSALVNGFVTISPCQNTFLDKQALKRLKNLQLKI